MYSKDRTSYENSMLKLYMCTQIYTKFRLEIFTINMTFDLVYFCEIIFESSINVCKTNPATWALIYHKKDQGLRLWEMEVLCTQVKLELLEGGKQR